MTDPWSVWAAGVLTGIGAPVDAVNADTLWAWSGAESGADRMRWNNPLNTTQPEGAGNVDANSVGVKIYPTVEQGIAATVITLLNGHYPLIVAFLRSSAPRSQWRACCSQLDTWGTGCAWLPVNFGNAPALALEDDMYTDDDRNWDRNTALRLAALVNGDPTWTDVSGQVHPNALAPLTGPGGVIDRLTLVEQKLGLENTTPPGP